jgi:hypothetical protein
MEGISSPVGPDLQYTSAFKDLFESEGIADPAAMVHTEVFDEVPFYSRYSQLEFLSGLTIAETNRQLIRASVAQLDRIAAHASARRRDAGLDAPESVAMLYMVSVTDWIVDRADAATVCQDGTTGLLVPHIWCGNLSSGKMQAFLPGQGLPRAFRLPHSACAEFVISALGRSPDYDIYESVEYDWCPLRVYIRRIVRRRSDQEP